MCNAQLFLFIGLLVLTFKSVTDTEKTYLSFSKDDVEKCKQKDLLEQMMAEMIGEFPDLHRTIVSERDIYLTYMLKQAAKQIELPRASESNCFKADIITSKVLIVYWSKVQFSGNLGCSVHKCCISHNIQCSKS